MPIVNYPFVSYYGSPKPAVPVTLINPANGFDYFTWALIDTGADATIIPEFIAHRLYHNVRHKNVKIDHHWGVGGQAAAYYHTFQMNILGSDQQGNISSNAAIRMRQRLFAVIPGLHVMVLGESDFLKKYILTINYPKKIFSLSRP